MPHYFVEGYRDGTPTPALYIQADNPDAAVARAAQLKMQEVTGVRLAKSPPPPEPPTMMDMLILLSDMLILLSFAWPLVPFGFPTFLPWLPILLTIIGFLLKTYQKQQKMQAEIDELRMRIQSGVSVDQ